MSSESQMQRRRQRKHRQRAKKRQIEAMTKPEDCSTSYAETTSTCCGNSMELNGNQIDRLRCVLTQRVEIHGRENFPTLTVDLQDLINRVRLAVLAARLHLQCVKLNGGAASHVLAAENWEYSDVDLIFPVSLPDEDSFDRVRTAVFTVISSLLAEVMPAGVSMTSETLKEAYIAKMVKVCTDDDRWSLFSLHNDFGRFIELKFVDRMRRQFEFSVDSFQIRLDNLLTPDSYTRPVVVAESVFGDIKVALSHLRHQLIDTRNPEEIRGGGLLKYCHLLARGYQATNNCRNMEKYMCSRFFIDFPDIQTQDMKVRAYLDNHSTGHDQMKLDYLQVLHNIIKESTICLMGHERRQTLSMIDRLRHQIEYEIGFMHAASASPLSVACTTESSMSGMSSPAPPSTASSEPSSSSLVSSSPSSGRSTLLYLPPNSNFWIPVV